MYSIDEVKKVDSEIAKAIELELGRQQDNIELIASENFVSKAVLATMGSYLTNKYAEGYPDKRYYGGCEYVDIAEKLAIDRVKEIYGAEHANVQPHSGSQANMAAYMAVLNLGDKVMGMNLSHGGHLTHGSPVNFSGINYEIIAYGVDENGYIDYDEVREIAIKEKPKMIIAGGSAYPREIKFDKFREIADEVGAYLMVDMAHIAGLIAAGLHQNPVPYADIVTSTTHKTLRGPRGGLILCKEELAKKIDKSIFPGIQGGPLMHMVAAKAVAFKEDMEPEFKEYQKQIVKNAKALAESLVKRGVQVVSGGTDNHMVLVDVRCFNLTGKAAEKMLDEVRVTCNKNTIPFDPEGPMVTSGVRIGTPAVTTRGMKEEDMDVIAEIMYITLSDFEKNKDKALEMVEKLLSKYPLYK